MTRDQRDALDERADRATVVLRSRNDLKKKLSQAAVKEAAELKKEFEKK